MPQRIASADVPRFARGQGLELAARQAVDGLYAGRHRSPRFGSSMDFADHRPYQDGDELRAIDWKVYARSDRLLVRRWHDDRQLPVALLLDTSASMAYGAPAKGDIARLTAAILGLLALDQKDKLRLFLAAKTERYEPRDAVHLCATLGLVSDAGSGAAAQVLGTATQRLQQRHLLVVFSDFLDDLTALSLSLSELIAKGHEVACVQILDRTELSLPVAWGPSRFTDPEQTHPTIDGNANDLSEAYADALRDHQRLLMALCAEAGADHLIIPTDGNIVEILGSWLARRTALRIGGGR